MVLSFILFMYTTFSSIYTASVWSLSELTYLLAVASNDGEQYGVETGAFSISKTTCLVAKKYKYTVLRAPCD